MLSKEDRIEAVLSLARLLEVDVTSLTNAKADNIQDLYQELIEYLYDCIARYGAQGIQHGTLSGVAKRVDGKRRNRLLKDLTESGRIIVRYTKKSRGPATAAYFAAKGVRPEVDLVEIRKGINALMDKGPQYARTDIVAYGMEKGLTVEEAILMIKTEVKRREA